MPPACLLLSIRSFGASLPLCKHQRGIASLYRNSYSDNNNHCNIQQLQLQCNRTMTMAIRNSSNPNLKAYDHKVHVSLIRHGESMYNEFRTHSFRNWRFRDMLTMDPGILDAPLSEEGFNQARALRKQLLEPNGSVNSTTLKDGLVNVEGIDLVLCSPLTRAIQTALTVFEGHLLSQRLHVLACASEWLDTHADIGKTERELRREFPQLDYAYLHYPSHCPSSAEKENRKVERGEGSGEEEEKTLDNQWWYATGPPSPLGELVGRKFAREPRDHVQRRCDDLLRLIGSRPESHICVVGHSWFFQLMIGGRKLRNCEYKKFVLDKKHLQLVAVDGNLRSSQK